MQPLVPLLDQFYYFALTIFVGMVCGFCYDLYKVTRGTLRLRRLGTALGDVLFWLMLTLVVFVLLLLGNWGEVRLYVLLGLALGAVIYLHFLSRRATSLLQWAFRVVHQFLKLLLKVFFFLVTAICFPFRILYLSIVIPLKMVAGITGKVIRGAGALVHKLVGKPISRVKRGIRGRLSSIFPIFEYKDDNK
ncbi:spore cortex biosynthesis protein YabQ [Desulfotomaculum nigrificans]|uniref:spore cortex biosynthesis protein YabQ n=1 Tax=Desulfotomaculum nigrificans TaxID=1565 RepID=UPI0002E2357B|nr:spore cortex biosynthesis protein YabQ [Desulfotomaculum nigrificans]